MSTERHGGQGAYLGVYFLAILLAAALIAFGIVHIIPTEVTPNVTPPPYIAREAPPLPAPKQPPAERAPPPPYEAPPQVFYEPGPPLQEEGPLAPEPPPDEQPERPARQEPKSASFHGPAILVITNPFTHERSTGTRFRTQAMCESTREAMPSEGFPSRCVPSR